MFDKTKYQATRAYRVLKNRARKRLPRRQKQTAEGYIAGLLSVVVPAYNVENFLEDCLDSLLGQSYPNIEVVIVDDGSTDRTGAMADGYSKRHRNVRVIHQPNAGLSRARNVGCEASRGEFLWFVDSDDTIPTEAANTCIEMLEQTGSDFVVGKYERFNTKRRWSPGVWVQDAHQNDHRGIRVQELPEILVNVIACSKIYRRWFWDKAGLKFQPGVLYEDKRPSILAYLGASGFDVISDVIYNWRARDDGSSITQQKLAIENLYFSREADYACISELERAGESELAQVRLIQLLSNNLNWIYGVQQANDEYWDLLSSAVETFTSQLSDSNWREIPPQAAVLEWIVSNRDRDRAIEYVRRRGTKQDNFPINWSSGTPHLDVPFADELGENAPRELLVVPAKEFRLMAALRRAVWESTTVLRVEGWSYIQGIDLGVFDASTQIVLVHSVTGTQVPLRAESFLDHDIDHNSKNQWNDYRPGGFRAWIDFADLVSDAELGDYYFEATTTSGSMTRTERIKDFDPASSIVSLRARSIGSGLRAQLLTKKGTLARLRLNAPTLSAGAVRPSGDKLLVDINTNFADLKIVAIESTERRSGERRRFPVSAMGKQTFTATFDPSEDSDEPGDRGLRAISVDGNRLAIDWPDPPKDLPLHVNGKWGLDRTRFGNLEAARYQNVVAVTDVFFEGFTLHVRGRAVGDVVQGELVLHDQRYSTSAPLRWTGDSWEASVSMEIDPWGKGERPLPIGRYSMEFAAGSGSDDSKVIVSEEASSKFPLWHEVERELCVRAEKTANGPIRLVVMPPLSIDERGARQQRRLQEMHASSTMPLRQNAVLFTSYYGESATCNPLAIHNEIRNRSNEYELYWTVQDSSVVVPEGAIGVIVDSKEWYEVMSFAKYIVDNMHEPKSYCKREGQVVVETYHGYQFKMAGRSHWLNAGYDVDAFIARQQSWDYLISPAKYSTPLLQRDFPSPAEILEIGYPRNDTFFSEWAEDLRERTRDQLGIPDNVTAVLYAPTFRDYLSKTERKAEMVEFLDLIAASEALGEDYVFLLRGHAMNARMSTRTASGGRVIDVTDHPEINELCLASDVAILDYSSLRFDYALTRKPMMYLVPDEEKYHETRGWMLAYHLTTPGPIVKSTDDVVESLKNLEQWSDSYTNDRERFIGRYMELEDGHASKRLVDAVFEDL